VVCISACWSRAWVVQKRINRSRCRLGLWTFESKVPCIRWDPGPPRKKALLGSHLGMSKFACGRYSQRYSLGGSSDATSGYSTVADSRVIAHLLYIIHVPWSAYVSVLGTLVSPANTVVPIKMPFGEQTSVDPRNRVLHGVYVGANWWIRLHESCAAAMRPPLMSNYF